LSSAAKNQGTELSQQDKEKKQKSFNKAETFLKQAIKNNPAYARAYFYLGNLYSWRAHDEEDDSSASRYEEQAKAMYTRTAMGTTARPREAGALSKFGTGLVDYRHYRKAKKRAEHLSHVHLLESAHEAFTASREQDPAFYLARTGNALVYAEKAELLGPPNKRKERERYLNRAIAELRDARAIAAELKDADSVKWLDKRILELESQKREGRETQERPPYLATRQ
jgi:hypothetical protein